MSPTTDRSTELLAKVRKRFAKDEVDLIERALRTAQEAHRGQRRGTDEAYVSHSVAVALALHDWHLDAASVAAALLHDVPEDTPVSFEEVRRSFGEEVAGLVEAVTKLAAVRMPERPTGGESENLRHLFLAMAQDVRVVLLKLADRLHNMRTLDGVKPPKRKRIAQETLEIYAPLADRLGMGEVRSELDDLGFRYADPKEYEWTRRQVQQTHTKRQRYIATVRREFSKVLAGEGIEATINARTKNLYSLYQKLLQKERDIDQIYDLFAIRVIVESVEDCYQGMGVIHRHWQPLPHRIKDYIAVPKLNGYRSLHTTIFGPGNRLLEVQLRTHQMHEEAELGIAAHAVYAERKQAAQAAPDQLAVMRQLASWHDELTEGADFVDRFKLDLFSKRVFAFTPKGTIHSLSAGSTPVDFAYTVHSEVGNTCVGAKINGAMAPLDTELANGDVVEILTKSNSNPKLDWLRFVRTGAARNHIRSWFRKQQRSDHLKTGRAVLDDILKPHGRTIASLTESELNNLLGMRPGTKDLDDVLAWLGEGAITETAILKALELEPTATVPRKRALPKLSRRPLAISVPGLETLATKRARCCNPTAGDPVIGYITLGHGISLHRRDCAQVPKLPDPTRIIPVSWKSK